MKICITWNGLASYSEAAIKRFIASTSHKVYVVASVPEVPKTTGDSILGVLIHWIPRDYNGSLSEIIGTVPDILVQNGWNQTVFNRFGDEVRARGGRVIVAIDNQFLWGWKLIPWIVRFNLKFRQKFAGYLIPGKSTARLLHWCGISDKYIARNFYTADPDVFTNGGDLVNRPKRMLYIGRFIDLKNVMLMIHSFAEFAQGHPNWELHCYGQGELQQAMEHLIAKLQCRQIVLHKFVQPCELADLYKQARVLVLPSFWDHWGVVVHEACLSGCAVLLSNRVGAGWNFCTNKNGVRFNPFRRKSLVEAFSAVANWSDNNWHDAQDESVRLAKSVSPDGFSKELSRLIERISKIGGSHV